MEPMRTALTLVAAVTLLWAGEIKLGKELTLNKPLPIATLLGDPSAYVDKTVQVKGKISEVCQKMGCWMNLVDETGKMLRIKVNDGEIEFPKNSSGKTAVAEGRFTRIELTREQAVARAKHEAEEMGRGFDPASIKEGLTTYQIQGTGAVILKANAADCH
jgi:hypothetical protein